LASCSKRTPWLCGLCLHVHYCSQEHLEEDRPRHEHDERCALMTPHGRLLPHVARVSTGILYKPEDEIPIDKEIRYFHTPEGPMPEFSPHFSKKPVGITLTMKDTKGKDVLVLILYSLSAERAGLSINKGIKRLTGRDTEPWRGPVLVMRFRHCRQRFVDIRANKGDGSSPISPSLKDLFLNRRNQLVDPQPGQ